MEGEGSFHLKVFTGRRICPQALVVVGFRSLWVAGQRTSVSYGLELPSASRCVFLSIWWHTTWQLTSSKPARESLLARHIKIFCNTVTYVWPQTSYHPCHIHCLEASHGSHLNSRGGDYTRVGTPAGGDHEGHPKICLPQVGKKQNLKLLMVINILARVVYQSRSAKCRVRKGRSKDFLFMAQDTTYSQKNS